MPVADWARCYPARACARSIRATWKASRTDVTLPVFCLLQCGGGGRRPGVPFAFAGMSIASTRSDRATCALRSVDGRDQEPYNEDPRFANQCGGLGRRPLLVPQVRLRPVGPARGRQGAGTGSARRREIRQAARREQRGRLLADDGTVRRTQRAVLGAGRGDVAEAARSWAICSRTACFFDSYWSVTVCILLRTDSCASARSHTAPAMLKLR